MSYSLGERSLRTLATVHPDMQKVVKRAITITKQDFMVVQGLRTKDEQARLYGQGRTSAQMAAAGLPPSYAQPNLKKVTWTMASNHLSGRAVDLAAWHNGAIDWNTNSRYDVIAQAMAAAANIEKIKIVWGGTWTTKDRPHFELPR